MENKAVLNQFKTEVANELGLSNYEQIDKGQLSSRQNGYVGGNMTNNIVLEQQLKFEIADRHYIGHTKTRTYDLAITVR